MEIIYKLENKIKHYDWGSPDYIPRLMGLKAGVADPWAELWMGCHPGSPSYVQVPSGKTSLGELIASDPRCFLGEKAEREFGSLPFLFKLLAAEKPLSIQAHPNKAQAREGFERENLAGLASNAPDRNYKDANHKPEIICALTPFTGMCGFREPSEIHRLLEIFLNPAPAVLREGFASILRTLEGGSASLRNFLSALFAMPDDVRKSLTKYILEAGDSACGDFHSLIQSFARLYPGDPSVIAPLYLNVFRLEPGEAVFLDAGILHAYVQGFGVELMANSDNVLRGGLTPKYIDVPELLSVLDFTPFNPRVIKPESGFSEFTYCDSAGAALCKEFSLTAIHGTGGTAVSAPSGPAICIVTEGEVAVSAAETGKSETVILQQGESAFIAAESGRLLFSGDFTLYAASIP